MSEDHRVTMIAPLHTRLIELSEDIARVERNRRTLAVWDLRDELAAIHAKLQRYAAEARKMEGLLDGAVEADRQRELELCALADAILAGEELNVIRIPFRGIVR